MPVLSITKTYLNGNILSQSDLDSAFNSISTFLNTTKLDSTNVQTAGLIGANLANSTITASQIAAGAIGTAQIASSAVGTAQLGPLVVTTANIASSAITPATRSAAVYGLSTSCGNFTTSSTSFVDITNLTITSSSWSGRPVIMKLVSDGTGTNGNSTVSFGITGTSGSVARMIFLMDATQIGFYVATNSANATADQGLTQTPNMEAFVVPSPGSHTFKAQVKMQTGADLAQLTYQQLLVYEL